MKNYIIKFRVSKIEHAVITKKAEDAGISVSEMLRGLAFNFKFSPRFTTEELEIYKTLSKFSNNFTRISNLFKNGDVEEMKSETLKAADEIRNHLKKFK